MSDNLSTVNVSDTLDPLTVEETRNLFFNLRVPLNILDDIAAQYNGANRKQHFIQKWLDMTPNASWEMLVVGLRKINKISLAAKIEFVHIPRAPVPSRSLILTSRISATTDAGQCKPKSRAKKQRREQKSEFEELGDLLPIRPYSRKPLDKLSILKFTIAYLKLRSFMTLGGCSESGSCKENILKNLLDKAMSGFLMVIGCDGIVLYASTNVESILGQCPHDLIGHSLYDLVLSEVDKDVIRNNLMPEEGHEPNQHRMFCIQMCNAFTTGSEEDSTNVTLQLSGHLKVIHGHPPPEQTAAGQKPHVLGLIVECQPTGTCWSFLKLSTPHLSFSFTFGLDMKIRSVDTRVVDVVGFDERDFIGCNVIDYFHPSDNAKLIPCLHLLRRTGYACSPLIRFMMASGSWAWIQLEGNLMFDTETREPTLIKTLIKIVSLNEVTLEDSAQYSHLRNTIFHPSPADSSLSHNTSAASSVETHTSTTIFSLETHVSGPQHSVTPSAPSNSIPVGPLLAPSQFNMTAAPGQRLTSAPSVTTSAINSDTTSTDCKQGTSHFQCTDKSISNPSAFGPASYQFQTKSTFDLTTHQPQHLVQALPFSDANCTFEHTLKILPTHQSKQQHPPLPPPPSHEWIERQRKLEKQTLRQRQLLQDLLMEHQMMMPAGQTQVKQQSVNHQVQSRSQNTSHFNPVPQKMTNAGNQNELSTHTSLFHQSVDGQSSIAANNNLSPPSPDTVQYLLQQLL